MGRFNDLTGQKFNRLTVIKRADNIGKHTAWYCNCDCGSKNVIVTSDNLKSNNVKSCGCLQREKSAENGRKRAGVPNIKNKRYNKYDLETEKYGIGYTLKGEAFYFDKEDYELIKDCCWWINDNGYVVTSLNNNKKIRMHRLVMGDVDSDIRIDHINHNTLDNRKCNLREATNAENLRNGKLRRTNKSGVVGVSFDKQRNKWAASITVDSEDIYLGRYDCIEDAIKARKEAEEKYFGEYSYDNSMKLAQNY